MALAMVGLLGGALIVIGMLVVSRATLAQVHTAADRDYEDALFVAESGVDVALIDLSDDPTYATVSAGTNLTSKSAIVAAAEFLAASEPGSVIETPSGEFIVVKAPDSDFVYGVGFTPSVTASGRKVRVVEATVAAGSEVTGCWPEAAIIGRGLIEPSGAQIYTTPPTEHVANVLGNFDFKGNAALWLDGEIHVAGTIFNTPPGSTYGVQESGADPVAFPSDAEIAAWEAELIAEAQAGGTISGFDISSTSTISAPVYIDGDVTLNSGAFLTITGPGTVYVNGSFELKGNSTLYNGSVLAVRDFFKQGGGTQYRLAGSPSSVGLVSFYVDPDAIQFEGAATGHQGVIYSAKGGIKLNGSAALLGAAIAGGYGADGQIKYGGGSDMTYPAGLMPSASWLPNIVGGEENCGVPIGLPEFQIPDVAIAANGKITLSGNANTYTDPAEYHGASIATNGDFSGSGDVDGAVYAVGSASGGTAHDGFNPGAPPIEFPDQSVIDDWEAYIMAQAQAGPTVGTQSFGSDTTIYGPLFINGDLNISGDTLRVEGYSTVYVTGKIVASGGATILNSGLLASAGEIKVSGTGAYYTIGDPNDVLLVSFAESSKALELSGGSTGQAQGIAYAANGGVVLSGGSTFVGALSAGGEGNNGKVTLSGGASITYTPGWIGANNHIPGGGAEGSGGSESTGLVLLAKTEL